MGQIEVGQQLGYDHDWMKYPHYRPEYGIEVLGYSKKWIDEDYTPDGECLCFLNNDGVWNIAKWCGQHDEWHTRATDEKAGEDIGIEETITSPTHWRYKPKPPID